MWASNWQAIYGKTNPFPKNTDKNNLTEILLEKVGKIYENYSECK